MRKKYRADLHIHSCLSPCADLDMTPVNIIRRAVDLGLDIIAISDHNTAEHVEVARKLAKSSDLTILPAMEITTSEEVHILALFGELDDCLIVQDRIHASLSAIPSYTHDETSQPIVNEKDEVLSFNQLPLINATSISLSSLVGLIHENSGIAIACHIDREAFSIISQLGFIPDGLPLDAVEVSFRTRSVGDAKNLLLGQNFPIVSFSDAHHLKDLGRRTSEFLLAAPEFEDIIRCLKNDNVTFTSP